MYLNNSLNISDQDIVSNQMHNFDTFNQNMHDAENYSNISNKIGRYIVSRELGRGSMGKVYLAYDPFIDRKVAIKTALTTPNKKNNERNSNLHIQQSFFNEARATGKLLHPNIVALYDAFEENGIYYLVMEYVEGTTLREYCKPESDLSMEKAIDIIFHCAKALDFASNKGIIHRDIKPNNILIAINGEAKILDFSIAVIDGFLTATKSASFTGSVFYTPPEVLRDEQLTAKSDMFSLGVVMYELLTGVKPFNGDNEVAVFYEILNKDPEPLRKHRKDIPEFLERIIFHALEKNPESRYMDGAELAYDLCKAFDKIRFLDEKIDFQEKFIALKKLHFFEDFTCTELDEVIKATQWLEYEPDATIITEGEIDDCFYIIITGEVAVLKEGKSLASLNQGDCFGEMAYLGKTTRTADIKALRKTVLMKLNASIMEETSHFTQNRFYKVFSRTLIQRLSRANQEITKPKNPSDRP